MMIDSLVAHADQNCERNAAQSGAFEMATMALELVEMQTIDGNFEAGIDDRRQENSRADCH